MVEPVWHPSIGARLAAVDHEKPFNTHFSPFQVITQAGNVLDEAGPAPQSPICGKAGDIAAYGAG